MWRNIPPARLFGVRILFMTVLSQERVGNCSAPIQPVGALPAKAAILPRADNRANVMGIAPAGHQVTSRLSNTFKFNS